MGPSKFRFPFLPLLCWLILSSVAVLGQQSTGDFEVREKIPFLKAGGEELTLDLYLPSGQSGAVPCIIVIQGGGFFPQDGRRFRIFAEYIAENGFAAALISYRGRPEYRYPTTIQDVRSALCFIKNKGAEYGIDITRIGAMGRSAGATLAAFLAVAGNDVSFDSANSLGVTSGAAAGVEFDAVQPCDRLQVQAVVAYAGVFDFISRFTDPRQLALHPEPVVKQKNNEEWIGTPFSANDFHWKNASAINHVDAGDSPMLFMHCKDDKTVPWVQSQLMYEKMKSAGVPAEILYFEKGGHGFHTPEKASNLEPMIAFFRKQLE